MDSTKTVWKSDEIAKRALVLEIRGTFRGCSVLRCTIPREGVRNPVRGQVWRLEHWEDSGKDEQLSDEPEQHL